jgi:hypothetical protein
VFDQLRLPDGSHEFSHFVRRKELEIPSGARG